MFNLAPYPHSYADCQAYVNPLFCKTILNSQGSYTFGPYPLAC